MTKITVMLAVSDGKAAAEFYQKAFGAEPLWHMDAGDQYYAGVSIDGAEIFLATESPDWGTRSPSALGFTTARIELYVDDPAAVLDRAIAAGATPRTPVEEHNYPTEGPHPVPPLLQGSVFDPFGHIWILTKEL